MLQRVGISGCIVEEVQCGGAVGLTQQLTAHVVVGMLRTIDGFARPQAIAIVGIADGIGAVASCCQILSLCPGEGPAGADKVAEGVADYVRATDRRGYPSLSVSSPQ